MKTVYAMKFHLDQFASSDLPGATQIFWLLIYHNEQPQVKIAQINIELFINP